MKTESEIYVEAEIYAKTEKEKRLFGQRVSSCISTEEFQIEAYIAGFLKCKKEYEEKLRWILVDEELPNECTFVLTKYKNTYSVSWYDGEFNEMYNPTHWRPIL